MTEAPADDNVELTLGWACFPTRSADRKAVTATSLKQGGRQMSIWTILFVILLIAWISGFTVFHVAGGLIHLLLVFAVISLILHFVLGRSAA